MIAACSLESPHGDGEIPPIGESNSGPHDAAMCGKKRDTEQETELKMLADSSPESSS